MWLSNFKLVLADRIVPNGSVRVENSLIAEIAETEVEGGVNGAGLELFPGLIDMHGDMIEVELEPRPRVDFPIEIALNHLDARLAAAGVTTAYAAVSFSRDAAEGQRRSFDHTSRVIQGFYDFKSTCKVDHKIHARFDITYENAVPVLEALLSKGLVDLVSLMDHTPGQGQHSNIEKHIKVKATQLGVSEPEARQIVLTKIAKDSRPTEVILQNMIAVSELCKHYSVALASHDDDTEDKAKLMSKIGAVISEFPVTLQAARAGVSKGMMVAMGAPNAMRGQSYSGNLSARDAHAQGLLHILAADYHPAAILPAIRILGQTDPDGLVGATRLATLNPASALGLKDRGEIAVGKRADLIAVAEGTRVVCSYIAGQMVYSDGSLSEAPQQQKAIA
ncbi:MAG: alpha-D-ribose 1-methylphosphonate 5-triphosphate diphosphatase [Octadecabacter sp.]|nr:alpha-D-ribose 1-methylphosphonate 5-triphosphate diphosphatase [Octadecabacter sp.]